MEQNQNNILDDFSVDDEAKTHFKDIAQWAGINAVVAFVSLGLSLITTIYTISMIRNGGVAGTTMFGFLIGAAVSLLLNITLLQASSNIKKGLVSSDQGYFGLGLTKLAAYFRITGILIIIGLVLVVLALLFVMVLGAGRGF